MYKIDFLFSFIEICIRNTTTLHRKMTDEDVCIDTIIEELKEHIRNRVQLTTMDFYGKFSVSDSEETIKQNFVIGLIKFAIYFVYFCDFHKKNLACNNEYILYKQLIYGNLNEESIKRVLTTKLYVWPLNEYLNKYNDDESDDESEDEEDEDGYESDELNEKNKRREEKQKYMRNTCREITQRVIDVFTQWKCINRQKYVLK